MRARCICEEKEINSHQIKKPPLIPEAFDLCLGELQNYLLLAEKAAMCL